MHIRFRDAIVQVAGNGIHNVLNALDRNATGEAAVQEIALLLQCLRKRIPQVRPLGQKLVACARTLIEAPFLEGLAVILMAADELRT